MLKPRQFWTQRDGRSPWGHGGPGTGHYFLGEGALARLELGSFVGENVRIQPTPSGPGLQPSLPRGREGRTFWPFVGPVI